jgi:hypothetical protein
MSQVEKPIQKFYPFSALSAVNGYEGCKIKKAKN